MRLNKALLQYIKFRQIVNSMNVIRKRHIKVSEFKFVSFFDKYLNFVCIF